MSGHEPPFAGEDHARWRDLLGSYVLGHLDDATASRVRAHLDGCAACRADVAEVAPVARLLDDVEPGRFEDAPVPPPDLGRRLLAAVRAEADDGPAVAPGPDQQRDRGPGRGAPRRRWALVGLAAAAALVVGVTTGVLVGRPDAPASSLVRAGEPFEPVDLRPVGGSGVQVEEAGVVPHTWGLELRMAASGFAEGEAFRAEVRTDDGRLLPAGEFLGTGGPMTCNLQSAVLLEDADALVVEDGSGRVVLRTAL